jgi:NifB/MoaA-like Fe-S oxidoreductase
VIVNTVVTDGTLTIGYKVESSNAKFVIVDNFRLIYNGNGATGINQPMSDGISVYPTITQSTVRVNTLSVAEIHLSDITGKILDSRNSAGGVYELNISNISNGIYFVTVITENRKAVYKVLKR